MFRDYNKRIYDVGQVIVIILSEEKTGEQRHEESTRQECYNSDNRELIFGKQKVPGNLKMSGF